MSRIVDSSPCRREGLRYTYINEVAGILECLKSELYVTVSLTCNPNCSLILPIQSGATLEPYRITDPEAEDP